ncbi:unnamed protein product (mitochondrion) [Plasmodiophora brassicae]|uniref:Peptidase S54 rhomboid domain-containing protein n=1 Tax=Plasmodiophora brassicae TaxID=37360 RepID=A0A0G4III9_PLABS|nr:hypothetical protein PBRA_003836 [Plasmodiophora brassicae]SPQ94351.1 unnamed protein product [Plasmodiophora brassicae]
MAGIWHDLVRWPLTSATVAVCFVLWVWHWNSRSDLARVASSYRRIVIEKQVWRCITSTYSHGSVLHLAFNMSMAWSQGQQFESQIGTVEFARVTTLFIVVSSCLSLGATWLLVHRMNQPGAADKQSVGYSAVLFAWYTAGSMQDPWTTLYFLGIVPTPRIVVPILALLFTQLLIANASFVGHLSGIVAGLLFGLDLFSWFTTYFFLCSLTWIVIGMSWSVKTTTNLPVPFLVMLDNTGHDVVHGVVIRRTRTPGVDRFDEVTIV